MSFKRLEADDFVISADSISATLWSGGSPTLTTFFTSSTQEAGSSGDFYLNIYQTASTDPNAAVQFAIAYGNALGSGSSNYNSAVNGKSPSATVFGQYQNLVIGDENTNFTFGNITASEFFALSVDRARYKEKIFLGSLSLTLSGSSGSITLTDNSNYVSSVQFNEAGRVFQLITGSQGIKATITSRNTADGYSATSGSYGWLLPDIGTIILNPLALASFAVSGGIGLIYTGSTPGFPTPSMTGSSSGSVALNSYNNAILYRAISGSSSFRLNSEETITSDYIFVRARSSEFNYSENPSYISGSTGEVLYSDFINSPQTYITTVGLYNDSNELLAVAKLSRPLLKDFTKEALVRVKLDF
jgi:hypothetical protein